MATSNGETSLPAVFITKTPYPLPTQKFMIPSSWRRYQLSQLVNKALALPKPVPFDFILNGEILRSSLGEWCAEKGVGEEETLQIEYIESVMPPQRMSSLPHEDWVSGVTGSISGYFLTASYDGHLRAFDYSQKQIFDTPLHTAPITSLCVVPIPTTDSNQHLVATSSHDLTARISRVTFPDSGAAQATPLASLHLHTAPVASVSASPTGANLLTASWDGLIGFWDTVIPTSDEVPVEDSGAERKKRRKVADENFVRRKAPLNVLKSHTAKVSKAVFDGDGKAVSCGWDSTVRTWDVENGVCTNTITASEKPFLDLALTTTGTALAASTDRTVTLYDLRTSTLTSSSGSLQHPSTPSCVVASPTAEHQAASGAYDGTVRVWDLRGAKAPVATFKSAEGGKKVLALGWERGMIVVGGEGGLEVWKVGDGVDL